MPLITRQLTALQNASLEPEKYVDRPPDPQGWNGRARADIRATENRVLALWISTSFTKTSLAVVFAFAFVSCSLASLHFRLTRTALSSS